MKFTPNRPFVFLGCGNMGGALLDGFLTTQALTVQDIVVIAPSNTTRQTMEARGIRCFDSITSAHEHIIAGIYLLAVKPQILDSITTELPLLCDEKTLVLSVAGGKNLNWLAHVFGSAQPLIWAMPNTPVQVGAGVIPYCCSHHVTSAQQSFVHTLFSGCAHSYFIENPTQMDALTALSGCGPAWVFLLTEMMSKAAQQHGIAPDFASKLARETIIGAAALMQQEAELSATELRHNVTSPKGITFEAMEYLQGENGWTNAIMHAFDASVKRSIELAKGTS